MDAGDVPLSHSALTGIREEFRRVMGEDFELQIAVCPAEEGDGGAEDERKDDDDDQKFKEGKAGAIVWFRIVCS